MHLTMKSWVVIVGVALLVLAVSLAVLLVPSTSWAAGLEWFLTPTNTSPCGCGIPLGSNS
jgi:hypothetical protein